MEASPTLEILLLYRELSETHQSQDQNVRQLGKSGKSSQNGVQKLFFQFSLGNGENVGSYLTQAPPH
jgi:hypothetical protein